MDKQINFTKLNLEKLQPSKTRAYVYDSKIKGLALSITPKGSKSFIVYKKFKGKPIRITLGKFPSMTVEQARKTALDNLSKLSQGINPIDEQKSQQASHLTLQEIFDAYIITKKNLKPSTIEDYQKTMRQSCTDWLSKPMAMITKDMVAKRHAERGKKSPARANNAFRVLRALFNFAKHSYEDAKGNSIFPDNPVSVLSLTQAWFKVNHRQTFLRRSDLAAWMNAVLSLKCTRSTSNADAAKDYLLFLLLTGCRRTEAATLQWQEVDLQEGTFTLLDPKNRHNITLPMSDFLLHIIKQRHLNTDSPFVFPGITNNEPIKDIRGQVLHVEEQTGIKFTFHDLRRTFATIGDALDISRYCLKKLLNHKSNIETDITAGYIMTDNDRLKNATQRITDFILQEAGMGNK